MAKLQPLLDENSA